MSSFAANSMNVLKSNLQFLVIRNLSVTNTETLHALATELQKVVIIDTSIQNNPHLTWEKNFKIKKSQFFVLT